jgi:hypothetical protein
MTKYIFGYKKRLEKKDFIEKLSLKVMYRFFRQNRVLKQAFKKFP